MAIDPCAILPVHTRQLRCVWLREFLDLDLLGSGPRPPKVVSHLHPEPSLRCRTEGLRQTKGHLDRYAGPLVHQLRQRLTGYSQTFRRALRTWFRTVCELRFRSSAISPISSPRANRRNTSTSRMDRGSTWPPAESADPSSLACYTSVKPRRSCS